MRQTWPVMVIAAGISLVPAGLYKLRRMKSIYLFPAISLIVLGIFFSLFSFHILKVSLSTFIHQWWPLFFVIIGVILVVLYFIQQIRRKDFPYMDDDSLMEDD
jgi:FtsH-binding integral membrane protein